MMKFSTFSTVFISLGLIICILVAIMKLLFSDPTPTTDFHRITLAFEIVILAVVSLLVCKVFGNNKKEDKK